MKLESILADIREARFGHGTRCPRCGGRDCPRWGTARKRQRYKCKQCLRTFNDLTGTPAAWTKRLDLWPLYGHCLDFSVTIREAAARTGVHLTTAFRWRHRYLSDLAARDAECVQGWTELASMWFAYSEKGSRRLGRAPRPRGLSEPWPSARLGTNVVIAADRRGHVTTSTIGLANGRRPSTVELEYCLGDRVLGTPILVAAEGSYGPVATQARRRRGEYHDARSGYRRGRDSHMARLSNAEEYARRLRGWMLRFRGVATKYLPNYLTWHRAVDMPLRRGLAATALRWPIESGIGRSDPFGHANPARDRTRTNTLREHSPRGGEGEVVDSRLQPDLTPPQPFGDSLGSR